MISPETIDQVTQLAEIVGIRQMIITEACSDEEIRVWLLYSVLGMKVGEIALHMFPEEPMPGEKVKQVLNDAQVNILTNILRGETVQNLIEKNESLRPFVQRLRRRLLT